MTTEDRLARIEDGFVRLVELNENVVRVLVSQQEQLEEYRRDVRQYQRLWVHLARKHGWLEEGDWPPPEEQRDTCPSDFSQDFRSR